MKFPPPRLAGRDPSGKSIHRGIALVLFTFATLGATLARAEGRLPADFVDLGDIAPAIGQEIRYAGSHNFTGRPLPGYGRPRCLLRRPAAAALALADAHLAHFGLGLKVYDCYRPERAVRAMLAWSQRTTAPSPIERWFLLGLSRQDVVGQHFVARRSAHSRGAAIDVTLVERGEPVFPLDRLPARGQHCQAVQGGLGLGTAHDCFAEASATRTAALPVATRIARALLVDEMRRVGFVNYHREWWHFSFLPAPAPPSSFDFPIE